MTNQALADYFAKRKKVAKGQMPELDIEPLWSNARMAKALGSHSPEELLHKVRDEYEGRIKEIHGQCKHVIEFQHKGNVSIRDECERLEHIEWNSHRALDTVDALRGEIRELEAEICKLKSGCP